MEDNLRTDQHKLSRLQTIQKTLELECVEATSLAENKGQQDDHLMKHPEVM